jgi:hypothetical protein
VVQVVQPSNGSVVVNADQTVTYTPAAGFSGSDSFTYRASDGELVSNVATVSVTVNAVTGVVVQYATFQSTVFGSVSGGLDTLSTNDGSVMQLTEVHTGGPQPRRVSRLEHSWTFEIERGESIMFHLQAWRTNNSEGDDFVFTYSTDGGASFLPLVMVNSANSAAYMVALPATISGQVIVKVMDTDRTVGRGSTDSLFIDRMVIETTDPLPPLPTVTVVAPIPNASEAGSEGQFVINRDDVSSPLTVYYWVSGTATPGDDYEPLLGVVFFAVGQASVPIQVVPIDDDLAEGNESVVLTLVTDAAYQIGSPFEQSVVIVDDDLSGVDLDAASQQTAMGTVVSGTLADTYADDDIYLQIREEGWAGGKRSRLEHRWTFNVAQPGSLTFHLQAHRTANEGFGFAYSLDGSVWIEMLQVAATSETGSYQTFQLPAGFVGVLHVRVVDLDRSSFEPTLDSVFIDDMFVRLAP